MMDLRRIADQIAGREGDGPLDSLHRSQEGTALTEFAICMPVFLIVFSGMWMFTNVMNTMIDVEVRAAVESKNAIMELQRTDILDVGASADLAPHLSQTTGGIRSIEQYTSYPANQPEDNIAFDGLYIDSHNNNSFLEASTFGQQYNPDIRTLMEDTGGSIGPMQFRLFGDPDYWAMDTIDDTSGDFEVDFDDAGGPVDYVMELGNSVLESSGARHAAAVGSRYGTYVHEEQGGVEGEIMMFDYDAGFKRHYGSAIPPVVPEAGEEDGEPGRESGQRAASVTRLSIGANFVYPDLLQIGDADPDLDFDEDDMLTEVDLEYNPWDAGEIFSDMYGYDDDDE